MHENLSKRPGLLIVSDTAVYVDSKGEHVAFEPVVREIENFAHLFGTITWIAFKYELHPEIRNIRAVRGVDIQYVLLPAVGGRGLNQRLRIVWTYIRLILMIPVYIRREDIIHTRGPSHPALITIFYSILFFRHKAFWHKYAGNWIREKDPSSYRLNKFLLKKAKRTKVIINGQWPDQPVHVLSFENPCLNQQERIEGEMALKAKSYDGKLDFVFVGQLVDTKGILKIIEALKQLHNESRIGLMHFIGDGKKRGEYEELVRINNLNCLFHGFLPKERVNRILAKAHVLILASDSEGFPKVVAEGANYGCIPIVSDISCLSQYVKNNINGFVMPTLDTKGLVHSVRSLLSLSSDEARQMAKRAHEMGDHFTYDYYNLRIKREILS